MEIKLIGFLKEYDNVAESQWLKDVLVPGTNNIDIVYDVIRYLSRGKLVMSWMGFFDDIETNKPIEPHSYDTDGYWIWPSYFPYYIFKYNEYKIDNEFLSYIESKKHKITPKLKKADLLEIENLLTAKFIGNVIYYPIKNEYIKR